MRRFLVKGKLLPGNQITLPEEESRHARLSLRLAPGDHILLANGEGLEAEARILDFTSDGATLEIIRSARAITAGYQLELIQSPLKGPRMDWLVEKAAELGLHKLRLLQSAHTVGSGDKIDRWHRLAGAAMKQSGNLFALDIVKAASFAEVLQELPPSSLRFILSPGANLNLAAALNGPRKSQSVVLAIGPEGGFSPAEEKAFQSAGFLPCRLSRQILRGETAALAALAVATHILDSQERESPPIP